MSNIASTPQKAKQCQLSKRNYLHIIRGKVPIVKLKIICTMYACVCIDLSEACVWKCMYKLYIIVRMLCLWISSSSLEQSEEHSLVGYSAFSACYESTTSP